MRPWRFAAGAVGAGLLLAAGFSASAPFAAEWHARIALPFASLIASVSERLPFPLLEPLALILLVWAATGFHRGFRRGLSRLCAMLCALLAVYVLAWLPGYFVPMERILPVSIANETTAPNSASLAASVSERLPFLLLALILLVWAATGFRRGWKRGLSRLSAMLCALLAVYVLAWLPGYFVPMERILPAESASRPVQSDPKALETLCRRLIGELNASQLRFAGGEGALKQATEAVNDAFGAELSESAARFARYPEWMAALELAGFYSPWTGEALVSPRLAAAALPFTACHELAHRLGVADEGAANIAAWIACRRAGGELADSAALWALRYAMTELRTSDEAAWRRCAQSMKPPLLRTFTAMNGFAAPTSEARLPLPGTSSYSALIPWLLAHPDAME